VELESGMDQENVGPTFDPLTVASSCLGSEEGKALVADLNLRPLEERNPLPVFNYFPIGTGTGPCAAHEAVPWHPLARDNRNGLDPETASLQPAVRSCL
jgi:hypothetical protein